MRLVASSEFKVESGFDQSLPYPVEVADPIEITDNTIMSNRKALEMQRIELLWYLLGTHSMHSHNKCLVGENGKCRDAVQLKNSIPIHQHRAVHMAAACPATADQDCFKASQSSCHGHSTT